MKPPANWPPEMRTDIEAPRMRYAEDNDFLRRKAGDRCLFPSIIIRTPMDDEYSSADETCTITVNHGGNGFGFPGLEGFDRLAILLAGSTPMLHALKKAVAVFNNPRIYGLENYQNIPRAQREALEEMREAIIKATKLPDGYKP